MNMDKEQIDELNKAISKLSEEEQEQIAAAGVISDLQCEKMREISKFRYLAISYGVVVPTILKEKDINDKTKSTGGKC